MALSVPAYQSQATRIAESSLALNTISGKPMPSFQHNHNLTATTGLRCPEHKWHQHSSNPPAQSRKISLALLVCMLDISVTRKTASHRARHAMLHAYVCRV